MSKRICLILMFALFALGPAQAQVVVMTFSHTQTVPKPRIGNLDSIHTVAVLSVVGTSMTLQNRRFIGSRSKEFDITDWKVDDQVTTTLRQYLGGRFSFKDVPYDRAALVKISNGPLAFSAVAARRYLESVPKDGIDAFIIVRPSLYYDVPGLLGLALENGNG